MKKPSLLAIDGDLVAYRAAAAVETASIVVTHTKSGKTKSFKTRTEFYGHWKKKAGGWLAKTNKDRKVPFKVEDFTIEDTVEVEPVENACQVAKQMVKGIVKGSGLKNYTIVLDGEGNFRKEVATIAEYKGNRKDKRRPDHLKAVMEYLHKFHPTKEANGIEADDILAIMANNGEAVQATIDKDAYQVEGWIYDWEHMDKPFEVKEGVGLLWLQNEGEKKEKVRGYGFKQLMWQMLVGDKTDNILPRKLCEVSFGEKSAYHLLKPLKSKKECLEAVLRLYKEWYPEEFEYGHWNGDSDIKSDYMKVASEIFTLLYMLREEDDKTTFESFVKEVMNGKD